MKVFNSLFLLISSVGAFSSSHVNSKQHSCPTELYAKQDVSEQSMDRRSMLSNSSAFAMAMGIGLSLPSDANAQTDCMSGCLKECKQIAPKVSTKYIHMHLLICIISSTKALFCKIFVSQLMFTYTVRYTYYIFKSTHLIYDISGYTILFRKLQVVLCSRGQNRWFVRKCIERRRRGWNFR